MRLFVALAALAPAGCFGVSQNPSYFPFYLPTGDIIRTHAKPPGCGYFANFDPHAVCLEVTPLESTGPTKTQFLITAAVTDENGQPRRSRRVEWMIEGVGDITEVDESGYFAGRGYKVDNRYAVSYTDYKQHTIKTGGGQEVCIPAGHTWCVVTSAVEGDTHVIVYAPEIANWERHKVFVTRHWCDAQWKFPPSTACPAGGMPVLNTRVLRASDQQPMSNYKVRYRVLDGPPAQLLPANAAEAEVTSDAAGEAKVTLTEMTARAGSSRIEIQVIRPETSGPGVVVGRGETTLDWQTPQLALTVSAPPNGVAGGDLPVTLKVVNSGQTPTQPVVVRMPIPQGVQFVAGMPPPQLDGTQLVWQFGPLAGGTNQEVRADFRTPAPGVITATASAQSLDGLRSENQATSRVSTPQLKIGVDGARPVSPGDPVSLEISVANTGVGPAGNVKLRAELDAGLKHVSGVQVLEVVVGTLAAGQSTTIPLTLTATQPGKPAIHVVGTADGNLRGEVTRPVQVAQRSLQFSLSGPATRYANRPAPWDVRVVNSGDAVLENVSARVRLPQELRFQSATGNGQLVAGEVVWALGSMRAGERRELQLTAIPVTAVVQATVTGGASADKVPPQSAEAQFEVMGMPSLRAEVVPPANGFAAGGKGIITVRIVNQGTLAARNVILAITTTPQFLTPKFAGGPTVGRVQGERVDFGSVDRIEAGQAATFQIDCAAAQAGDGRVRVEVKSDSTPAPLVVEDPIRVAPPIPTPGKPAR
jgi:hypothetical protein